jgi:hypothetical protein
VLQEHLKCLKAIQDLLNNTTKFNIRPISGLDRDNIIEGKFIEE